MLRRSLFLTAAIVAAQPCFSQEGEVFDMGVHDMRSTRRAYLPILADATWTVKRMNLPFRQTAYADGRDYMSAYLDTMWELLDRNRWDLLQGMYQGGAKATVANEIQGFMAEAAIRGLLAFAQAIGDNTLSRTYTFVAPFDGEYAITCRLKGDGLIRPRNRVHVFGPEGDVMPPFDEALSSDRSQTFRVQLQKGSYSVNVAVGSGASNMFHAAGTLSSVLFDNPTYATYTATVEASAREVQLSPLLPEEGSSVTVSVPYQPQQDPNIWDGYIQYSNPRPGPAEVSIIQHSLFIPADPAKGWYPGTYVFHQIHLNASANPGEWAGSAAFFTLVRTADTLEEFHQVVSGMFGDQTPTPY